MWRLLMVAFIAAAFPSSAKALVGEIDTSGRFSAVVRILSNKMVCTGVVLDRRMVLTAGHCLIDKEGGERKVFVQYTDIHGKQRTVPSRKVYVQSDFKDNFVRVMSEPKAKSTGHRGMDIDLKDPLHRQAVSRDIGIIVPDDDILVSQRIRTVIDRAYLTSAAKTHQYPQLTIPHKVTLAGFGVNYCKDAANPKTCRIDASLRIATTVASPYRVDVGNGQASAFFVLGPPKGDKSSKMPMRPGDSGSPIFATSGTAGDLILIATHSNSDRKKVGFAASLLENGRFVYSIYADETYRQAMIEKGAAAIAAITIKGRRVRVGIAWARADSTPEAEKKALAECRQSVKAACTIAVTYRSGCRFVTTGHGHGGRTGWLVGMSIQDVYARCKKKGVTCKKPIGGCL